MLAYVFPGQASQYSGMAKDLYDEFPEAKKILETSNEVLGFRLTDVMFKGTKEELSMTKITQPAVFIHSVAHFNVQKDKASAFAGHSLGEFSALVSSNVISLEDGIKLVSLRGRAMQEACDISKSAMAAVLGLEDNKIVEICSKYGDDVIAANFNCPGQVVISGKEEKINDVAEDLKNNGAKRVIKLATSGAFHSKFMKPAKSKINTFIDSLSFKEPEIPIYQNLSAKKTTTADELKKNLKEHVISPVRWTETIVNMKKDGITKIKEIGPGKVLSGLIRKIDRSITLI